MTRLIPLALAGLCVVSTAHAQRYDFTIDLAASGVAGPLSFDAQTAGTLIGDYEASANATGTRTKPGLLGTFGATENLPVPTSLGVKVAGAVSTSAAGAFSLDLDPVTGSLTMTDFAADLLSGGDVSLPVTLGLLFDSFRTRSPSSTFIGGLPLNVPIGSASLTQLAATQVGSGAGVLTPTGANTYDFSLVAVMLLTGEVSALGNSFQFPGQETPFAFAGSIAIDGATAVLTSFTPLVFANTAQPGVALPQFPLSLPTVLPPGGTANLLLDLTLTDIDASFDGTSSFRAVGTVVPVPGAGVLLLAGLATLGWRRRG